MNAKAVAVTLGIGWSLALALSGCSHDSISQDPAAQGGSVGSASSPGPVATRPAIADGGGPTGNQAGAAATRAASASGGGAATSPAKASGGGSPGRKSGKTSDVINFPPGGAASVVAWYHGRGGADFTSLTTTLDQASRAKTSGGVTAFARSCGKIKSAAQVALAAPPMPLASVASVYKSALTVYVTSATKCERVAATDSVSLRAAVGAVEANSSTLNRAAAVLIAALSRG